MSLVTSCPECQTAFHVKQDQLAASQGKVRCGKCGHVFDALSRLSELPSPKSESIDTAPPSPVAITPKRVDDTASRAKLEMAFRRKSLQWPFALLAFLLVMLAGLQTLYYLRTPITARWPQLRPPFEAVCNLLQCKLGLPQQAELLTIDDSDMQEDADREGLVHLSATLTNNAPFTQAYPLLELTLTDRYDKAVIRRAFTAAEYLPEANSSEGMAPGDEVRIRLALAVHDDAVAGYRLFVTYPSPNENH
ncbi:MAG TPA: DUF3426 domain-containing protein [Methylophilaceae bacterium]|nr:DUF3426 domain-containing protein [Methylophilaceae bacterium]